MKIHPGATPQNEVEQTVVDFIDSFGPCSFEEFLAGYDQWMTDDVVWTNTGSPPCYGKEAAMAFLEALHHRIDMEYCTVELFNLASRGNVVLTERIDSVHRADDSVVIAIPIMGTFEVRDGKIARYSDYSSDHELKKMFPAHAEANVG